MVAARTLEGAHLGRQVRLRLVRSIGAGDTRDAGDAGGAGDTRDAGVTGLLLLVVGLLLSLIVISAGCGPPS